MKSQNIGKSIYILLAIGIIVLTIVGIISNIYAQKRSLERSAGFHISNYHKQFDIHIENEVQMMKSFLQFIGEKKDIQTSFINSDKEKLFAETKDIYKSLNANNQITHFYFIKNDGEVLLRVHNYPRDSDIINRYTFLKAKKEGSISYGVEFGLMKNYTLRVVVPWIVENETIGYIEIGKEIDKVLDTLSEQLNVEVAIAIQKNQYNNAPNVIQEKLSSFVQIQNYYLVYSTIKDIDDLKSLFQQQKNDIWLGLKEKTYIGYIEELKDISDNKLGDSLFLVDMSLEYKELKTALVFYIFIMIMGSFLMLGLGYLYAKRKQKILDDALLQIDITMREKTGLLSLFEHGDSVLFKWNNDEHWSIDYVSSNVSNLLGYSKDDFLSSRITYADTIHEEDISKVIAEVEEGSQSTENFFRHDPYRIITKEDKVKWVLDYTVVIRDKAKTVTHFLGYIIDITKHEIILRNLEKFIDTQDNILILTNGEEISFANQKFFSFLGYESIDKFKEVSKCICEYFVENDRFFHLGKISEDENWLEVMNTLPEKERIVAILNKDKVLHTFAVAISKFENNVFIVSFNDISETMLNQIELENKTIHDNLTKAYNREYFELNYKKFIAKSKENNHLFALAFLDIDHFKLVNDTYGHEVGDKVLIQFVNAIQRISRESDVFIRWGGEEFILILMIKSQNYLPTILNKIRTTIEEEEFESVGHKTCSIGATLYKEDEDMNITIKRADDALYSAKNNGRNQVVLKVD